MRLPSILVRGGKVGMQYSFHIYNKVASDGITMACESLLQANLQKRAKNGMTEYAQNTPVIVCVGSDLAIGDSLGPITGSMLKYKTQGLKTFIYGTLSSPVTAKEIRYMRTFLKETHPACQVLAIDAAVGVEGDIGLMKLCDSPLFPGAGANKKLGSIGDISIMGIVAEKSVANFGLLNTTRLNLVYSMAEKISDALSALLWERASRIKSVK